jgi:hypothetical protein
MQQLTNLVTDLGGDFYRINQRIRINGVDISPTEMNNVPINGFTPSLLVGKTISGHYEGEVFVIENIS